MSDSEMRRDGRRAQATGDPVDRSEAERGKDAPPPTPAQPGKPFPRGDAPVPPGIYRLSRRDVRELDQDAEVARERRASSVAREEAEREATATLLEEGRRAVSRAGRDVAAETTESLLEEGRRAMAERATRQSD